jgi:DNA gyrase/topoisomerase IV subunit B
MAEHFDGKKIELSPSKALGEVSPRQLHEAIMEPATRKVEQVQIDRIRTNSG